MSSSSILHDTGEFVSQTHINSVITNLITVAVLMFVVFILRWVLQLLIRRVVNQVVNGAKKHKGATQQNSALSNLRVVQRTKTLGTVLSNALNVALFVVLTLMCFSIFFPKIMSSLTLLTAALGAACGFGAQSVIKDCFAGIFMVMEDQLGVGDIVDVGYASGIVEDVGIRVTQIRDVNGTLWFVRNGEIDRVGNLSQGWARAIFDIAVPVHTDRARIEEMLLATAHELSIEKIWKSKIIGTAELWGIESVSPDAVVLRLVLKTRSSEKDTVSAEFRSRILTKIEEHPMSFPTIDSVVLSGYSGLSRASGIKKTRSSEQKAAQTAENKKTKAHNTHD